MSTSSEQHSPDRNLWHRLLEEKMSRRAIFKRAIAAGAATTAAVALPLDLTTAHAEAAAQSKTNPARLRAPFRAIKATTADDLVLPRGFKYNVIRIYGDTIGPDLPFGYNADFTAYFPIDGLQGGKSSVDGLLWVNHEYVNSLLMYGYKSGEKSADQIRTEKMAVGGSLFRVQRQKNGSWTYQQDAMNRRMTGDYMQIKLTGPASGSAALKGATEAAGSTGNCSGGVTPWMTVLSCEENVDEYGQPTTVPFGNGWDNYRADLNGWVVELDPYNPGSMPRKHTAMGRFRHENVTIRLSPKGRVVAYMGDDKQDSCVYKFVSDGSYDPSNRDANMRLLESGKLYAADFQNGKWLLLDYATQKPLQDAISPSDKTKKRFNDQADVLFDARESALALRATPVDRPEDLEVHPLTGHVYIALTNNSVHGNFHGQIVRLIEAGNDPEAVDFGWDFFAVGGPQSGFSSPDNLIFDPYGNLWMVSDMSSSRVGKGIYKFAGNNSMFFFATEGPEAGKAVHFASGPIEAEMTGPSWTPDGKTLFLSIQHPGEETTSLDKLTSHWPNLNGDPMPRPGVVAISGFPGWKR